MKDELVKRMPEWMRCRVARAYSWMDGFGVFYRDKRKFRKHYSNGVGRTQINHLNARLTFYSHSIEKGLSREDIRAGFGHAALKGLAGAMKMYRKQGYSIDLSAYSNALSVLKGYMDYHKAIEYPIDYIENYFTKDIAQQALESRSALGGTVVINKKSKKNNRTANFKDLFTNRYSIRVYNDSPVDEDLLYEAIDISRKSPTVCNRQAAKVVVMQDSDTIAEALRVQGGYKGYSLPPVLLAVTVSLQGFIAPTERNQPYVDGGVFSMALLMALEYVGLAACPLNAMMSIGDDKRIHKIANIDDSEAIIMFIAVGNFKEKNLAPKSFRYGLDEIISSR